jgi:hypothetical protein
MVTENSVYISYYSVVFEEKMNEKTLAHHKIWKETQGLTHFEKIFLGKGRYT